MLLSDQLGPVNSVKVLDKLTYAGSLENLSSIFNDSRFKFVKGDICNEDTVNSMMNEGDIVVHFAAESHVDRSINGPSEFIKTNVQGTQVLLSAAVANRAKTFLHVSTDEVYGSVDEGSSAETDPLLPNSPYSASKAASDLLVRAYVKTYGLDARITRCCNNFGPNQYPEKFIPLSINCLKEHRKIPIYGDGSNVREWIHVGEHCRAIQSVIHSGVKGEIYNIGSGHLFTNLQLAEKILALFKASENWIEYVEDRKGHDYRYALNKSKIELELGFRIQYDFDQKFAETFLNQTLKL